MPRRLPRAKAEQALQDYDIPVHAGFLMGEQHSAGETGPLYLAFGKNDYGKGPHYFYLGLSEPVKEIPDGSYYFMDCLNAFVNNGLRPVIKKERESNMIGATKLRRRGRELGFDVKVDKKQTPYTYYIKDKQLDINPVIKTDLEGAAAFLLNGIDAYLYHCEMLDIEPF